MLRLLRLSSRLALVAAAACATTALGLVACSSFSGDGSGGGPGADGGSDGASTIDGTPGDAAPADAAPVDAATCDTTKPFDGNAVPLTADNALAVNSGKNDYGAWLTPDETRIYFASERDGSNSVHLYTASRAERTQPFGSVKPVDLSTHATIEDRPSLLTDQSLIVYSSESTRQLYVGTAAGGFFAVTKAGQPNDLSNNSDPYLTDDGELYFASTRFYQAGIFRAVMARDGGASAPTPVAELNVQNRITATPVRSADGLTLYFASDRDAGAQQTEIFVTRRPTTADPWGAPQKLTSVARVPAGFEQPSWISPDGCRLYFSSDRGGDLKRRLYVVSRN